MSPIQVLQYIASGALGSDAFKGGLATAALGAALHFFIAFVVAAVYYAASRKLAALCRDPTIWGLAFGAAVYLFMNFLVLPLSAVPKSPFSLPLFLNGVFATQSLWACRLRGSHGGQPARTRNRCQFQTVSARGKRNDATVVALLDGGRDRP